MTNTVADKLARKTRRKAPTKQVRLKLVYVDFWSAVKFSFLISLCLAVVNAVATILTYAVLVQTGALEKIDALFMDVVTGDEMSLMGFLGYPQVAGFAITVSVLGLIVGTVMGAIAAVVYNLLVRVFGGFQLGFTGH